MKQRMCVGGFWKSTRHLGVCVDVGGYVSMTSDDIRVICHSHEVQWDFCNNNLCCTMWMTKSYSITKYMLYYILLYSITKIMYNEIFVIIYEWRKATDAMRWKMMRVSICVDVSRYRWHTMKFTHIKVSVLTHIKVSVLMLISICVDVSR